eukprot:210265-Pelagomonas_calceolata.AAC.3
MQTCHQPCRAPQGPPPWLLKVHAKSIDITHSLSKLSGASTCAVITLARLFRDFFRSSYSSSLMMRLPLEKACMRRCMTTNECRGN